MPAKDSASAPAARSRLRLSIGAAVVLGLVVLSAAVGLGIMRGQAQPTQTVQIDEAAGDDEVAVGGELYVHVLGQVTDPGLYVLEPSARVVDALAAAGGSLDDADLQAVNLARPLSDGEQLIVPAVGADPTDAEGTDPVGDGLIDLNNADQAELETLPGIGPAIGQRIIDWRETNGRFASVDDLLAVSGIGEKLLAGLRDLVRV
ncbi:helix-hairpin-helix domain-containing protein [Microbacterium sp.]|uniref:helix-hairpin-helix domain-containing protein n=1 Tax=Microbacterium sp. TaxID=51671 RepID=UPI003F9CD6AE